MRNIVALLQNPNHIVCQGLCDQKNKGKACRITEAEINARLIARESRWKLIPMDVSHINSGADYVIQCRSCMTERYICGQALVSDDPTCPICDKSIPGNVRFVDIEEAVQKLLDALFSKAYSLSNCTPKPAGTVGEIDVTCAKCGTTFPSDFKKLKYQQRIPCPTCKKADRLRQDRERIKKYEKIAEESGLVLLTRTWSGSTQPLRLQCCACKHVFERIPEKLSETQSCPKCSSRIGENLLREILSEIFGTAFAPYRIKIKGKMLIFDGGPMNEDTPFLLAEYNGQQHYDENHRLWQRNVDLFRKQKKNDESKRNWAKKRKIPLLIIDHQEFFRIRSAHRAKFVMRRLFDLGFELDVEKNILIDNAAVFRSSKGAYRIKEIVAKKGGEILTPFDGYNQRIQIQCGNPMHPAFDLNTSSVIYQGTWCPACKRESKQA